ncbi:MAG: hypothetical protein LKE53_07685 [Oscillospiraceae bacterium]|jgi:hypothetical protein|nr:hypothetical protein [Oscillospiraceae bacterium]MDD3261149.1 hypothetical protein [Oscillospiraceae bacterium]
MANLDYQSFNTYLKSEKNDSEIRFYFINDPSETMRCIGHLSHSEKPYWAGCCDAAGGAKFHLAAELTHAKIFGGKSLLEEWDNVCIVSVNRVPFTEWLSR